MSPGARVAPGAGQGGKRILQQEHSVAEILSSKTHFGLLNALPIKQEIGDFLNY